MPKTTVSCDQCQMLSINGLPCHEIGCPNQRKVWRDGEWVRQYECQNCGTQYDDVVDAGTCCDPVDIEEFDEEWDGDDETDSVEDEDAIDDRWNTANEKAEDEEYDDA